MIEGLYKKQNILILSFVELPQKIQDQIAERESFCNDIYLNTCSEFEPSNYGGKKEDWSGCTMERIERYWQDQLKTNNGWCKSKTIEDFIEDYGLQFEKWLINDSGIYLMGVEKILIEVCW